LRSTSNDSLISEEENEHDHRPAEKVARRKLSLLQLVQLSHPTHGAQRVADELMLRGIQVSSGGVRGVWMRNDLLARHHRLLRLEETARKRKIKLTDGATGELVAVDTFFAGTLKGVGKVHIQTVLDCFSRFVWAGCTPRRCRSRPFKS